MIVMKRKILILIILIAILAACGPENSATQNTENTYSPEIYTAVALTLTAAVTPTNTALPTSTPTLTPTQTLLPTLAFETETPQPTPTMVFYSIDSCNNSAYVNDLTIPDGTVLMPGETFKKTWRLENTGTCPWEEEYVITFVSGYSMDGETTTINKYVAPGKTANITVALTAPEVEGVYTGYWLLNDQDGIGFGQLIYVTVVVDEDETEEEQE